MGDDLRLLPDVFHHARRSLRIARQNLLLSGAILVALVPLSALGILGLASVVAIHELAEVLVILNGVRAGRRKAFMSHPPLELLRVATVPIARTTERPSLPLATTPTKGGCSCCDG
jgi:cation-transporting ATPase G